MKRVERRCAGCGGEVRVVRRVEVRGTEQVERTEMRCRRCGRESVEVRVWEGKRKTGPRS